MEAALSAVFRILQVLLGIGFVIFVHELGHFLVAKWVGVRVETFSLGFGNRIPGLWFRRGDTEYRISMIPLGGYVKMAGEGPDDPGSGAPDEFASKSVGARSAVIVAGVCMNVIFAMIMFLCAFKLGVRMQEPAVGRVEAGTPADQAGLQWGDRILDINGREPLEFMDLSLTAAFAPGELTITLDRHGERRVVKCSPRRATGALIQQLGFGPMYAVHGVRDGTAAAGSGLREGDWILRMDGTPIASGDEIFKAIQAAPEKPIAVEVLRGGALGAKVETVTLTPKKREKRTTGLLLASGPILVGQVTPKSAALDAGIQEGDLIAEAFGAPADVASFPNRVSSLPPGGKVKLVILRGPQQERIEKEIEPRADPAVPGSPPKLGVAIGAAIVGSVAPGSPAAQAGVQPGDRITKLNGAKVALGFRDTDYFERLANEPESAEKAPPVELELRRKGTEEPIQATLAPVAVPGQFIGEAGLDLATASFVKTAEGIAEPIRLGLDRTFTFTEQVFLTLQGMVTQRISPNTLGGPIGIATAAYTVSDQGFSKLLYFLAIISVNLAVLNILPIPILDGGHLVFLIAEKIKGGPVSPTIQNAAQWVGLIMLLALMIYVTSNDIGRLIGG